MSDKPEATLQCNLTPDTTWREVRVEVDSLELGLCGLINHSFRDLGSRPRRCATAGPCASSPSTSRSGQSRPFGANLQASLSLLFLDRLGLKEA
jgi:hypothetical protein